MDVPQINFTSKRFHNNYSIYPKIMNNVSISHEISYKISSNSASKCSKRAPPKSSLHLMAIAFSSNWYCFFGGTSSLFMSKNHLHVPSSPTMCFVLKIIIVETLFQKYFSSRLSILFYPLFLNIFVYLFVLLSFWRHVRRDLTSFCLYNPSKINL